MAATVSLIQMLAAGCANTDGTPIASGRARFYQPGTLTPVTVYSDSTGTTAITPPLILTAGGTGTAYTQQPTRMIVKDATDTNQLIDANVNTTRAESDYVTSAAFNGGTETRLQTILDAWSTAFGGSAGLLQYKAYSDAVERNMKDAVAEIQVSVKNYGAVGNGVADDTAAIQAAVARAVTIGGAVVYFPPGTYLTSAAITIASTGVDILGAGSQSSLIKCSGGAQDGITFTSVGASAAPLNRVSRIGFTHSSSTTGSAVKFSNTISIDAISVASGLFRFGVTANGGSVVSIAGSSIIGNASDASSISINATGSGPSLVITGCSVGGGGAGQAAVQISNGTQNQIVGNVISGGSAANSDGIKVTSGSVRIVGNAVTSSLTSGNALNVTGGTAVTAGNRLDGATHAVNIGASGNALIAPGQTITPDILDARTATTAPVGYSFAADGSFTPLPLQTSAIRAVATAAAVVTINAIAVTGFGIKWSLICSRTTAAAVTWTFAAQYVLSAAVAPANGNRVNLLLEYNPIDDKVYEIGRAATAN